MLHLITSTTNHYLFHYISDWANILLVVEQKLCNTKLTEHHQNLYTLFKLFCFNRHTRFLHLWFQRFEMLVIPANFRSTRRIIKYFDLLLKTFMQKILKIFKITMHLRWYFIEHNILRLNCWVYCNTIYLISQG